MQMVLHAFLLDVPRAAGIWLALLLPAAVTLAAVLFSANRTADAGTGHDAGDAGDRAWATAPTVVTAVIAQCGADRRAGRGTGRRGSKPAGSDGPGAGAARPAARRKVWRPRAEAQEASRFAAEVAVAADRSAAIARRRRDEWSGAQAEVDRAWDALQEAEAAYRRLSSTLALPEPRTPRTAEEYAERERYLRRAAMAACWRRELSIMELSDALAHRGGWDPRRHPVEQEVHVHRVTRDAALARYEAAVAREREAWWTAEDAAAATRRLRDEAYAAAVTAWQAQYGSARVRARVAATTAAAARRPAMRWRAA